MYINIDNSIISFFILINKNIIILIDKNINTLINKT